MIKIYKSKNKSHGGDTPDSQSYESLRRFIKTKNATKSISKLKCYSVAQKDYTVILSAEQSENIAAE